MEEIGIREFKTRATEVLRRVREEGASYAITYRGKVVARLEPEDRESRLARSRAILAEMKKLAAEIGEHVPADDTSAVDLVREQRRR
jgi:prevent-host-death family protein